jgi:hypothetical protein
MSGASDMDNENDSKPDQVDRLVRIVDRAAGQVLADRSSADTKDSLFFVGYWHDSIPRAIWTDPLLDGTDVRIWGFLRSLVKPDAPAVVSVNARLEDALGYSKTTVTRSLSVLRTTRWISLCSKIRDERGRFRGHVYAVNAEPLSFGDAIRMDPGYLDFIEEQTRIKHPKVREIATAVLALIVEQIENNRDITEEESLVSRFSGTENRNRSVAETESHHGAQVDRTQDHDNDHHDNNVAMDVHHDNVHHDNNVAMDNHHDNVYQDNNIVLDANEENQSLSHQDKKVVLVPICSSRSSSSRNKKTTTTSTHPRARENDAGETAGQIDQLVYHDGLTLSERKLAAMYLERIDPDLRQDFLDELGGQIDAKKNGAKPIKNPIGYLSWMIERFKAGSIPLTSCGIRYRTNRERQRQAERQARRTDPDAADESKRSKPLKSSKRIDAMNALQDMRKSL